MPLPTLSGGGGCKAVPEWFAAAAFGVTTLLALVLRDVAGGDLDAL